MSEFTLPDTPEFARFMESLYRAPPGSYRGCVDSVPVFEVEALSQPMEAEHDHD